MIICRCFMPKVSSPPPVEGLQPQLPPSQPAQPQPSHEFCFCIALTAPNTSMKCFFHLFGPCRLAFSFRTESFRRRFSYEHRERRMTSCNRSLSAVLDTNDENPISSLQRAWAMSLTISTPFSSWCSPQKVDFQTRTRRLWARYGRNPHSHREVCHHSFYLLPFELEGASVAHVVWYC